MSGPQGTDTLTLREAVLGLMMLAAARFGQALRTSVLARFIFAAVFVTFIVGLPWRGRAGDIVNAVVIAVSVITVVDVLRAGIRRMWRAWRQRLLKRQKQNRQVRRAR